MFYAFLPSIGSLIFLNLIIIEKNRFAYVENVFCRKTVPSFLNFINKNRSEDNEKYYVMIGSVKISEKLFFAKIIRDFGRGGKRFVAMIRQILIEELCDIFFSKNHVDDSEKKRTPSLAVHKNRLNSSEISM